MEFLRTVLGDDLYAQVEGERYSKFALSFNYVPPKIKKASLQVLIPTNHLHISITLEIILLLFFLRLNIFLLVYDHL